MDNLDQFLKALNDLKADNGCTSSTSSQTPTEAYDLDPAAATNEVYAANGDQFSFKTGNDYLQAMLGWNNQFQTVVHTNKNYQTSYHQFSFDRQILEFREQLQEFTEKTDPGNNKCDKCDASFRFKTDLAAHMKNHPKPPVIFTKALPCSLCGEKFVNFDVFRVHRREKHPKIGFECETCGKRFEKKHNLRTHEKMHKKEGKLLKNQKFLGVTNF
ncbi:hypothetical protein CRE_05145 [Caenorhabditis remanei]|uniref:C2H2-type domain-containing protein n=1 Tax=Caenorhabditis remanei TaxID=31234 RepID=E3N6B3_CAERE|nr:hypothetical protein CRE_05145 [Caenorhabditis remanei]